MVSASTRAASTALLIRHFLDLQEIDSVVGSLTAIQTFVLHERFLSNKPMTLKKIGSLFNCSSENVRLSEIQLNRKLDSLVKKRNSWTNQSSLRPKIHVIVKRELYDILRETKPDLSGIYLVVASAMFEKHHGYVSIGDRYISHELHHIVASVKQVSAATSDDVGIVPKDKIFELEHNQELLEHWWLIVNLAGLHCFLGCYLRRSSLSAKLKAALVYIGRPATLKEVAKLAKTNTKRTGSTFSRLRSINRVTKSLWALEEWNYPVYEGIVQEIEKRIGNEGGKTRVSELRVDIQDFYGIKGLSIDTFLGTPKFRVWGNFVFERTFDELKLRPLETCIDTYDDEGNPVWRFETLERYFQGYSVATVPPEVILAMGCEIDRAHKVLVENLSDAEDLYVSTQWQRSSTSKGWIGNLTRPLTRLNAKPGDWIDVTLVRNGVIRLTVSNVSADHKNTN